MEVVAEYGVSVNLTNVYLIRHIEAKVLLHKAFFFISWHIALICPLSKTFSFNKYFRKSFVSLTFEIQQERFIYCVY